MDEIIYLIKQAYENYENNNLELSSSYDLDAWLSLKETLISKKIFKVSEIKLKSKNNTNIIKDFIYSIGNEYGKEHSDIEIIESMLEFFDFSKDELVSKNRALADCYYRINDFNKCDELYKKFIKEDSFNSEYYYAYALTLYNREEYKKAINILEDCIDNIKVNDTYVLASFELLISIYELLSEEENAYSTKIKLNNRRSLS